MNLTLHQIAKALGGEVSGNQVLAPAPGHSPKDRGLSVRKASSAPDGFLVHLFNGGDPLVAKDYVRAKLGIDPFKPNCHEPKLVKTTSIVYRDPVGIIRYHKKMFYRSDGTKTGSFYQLDGTRGLGGQPHLLYGAERLADIGEGQSGWIVEGERKVDRMHELGAIAVSNDCGAKSIWTPEHAQLFRGLDIILWPDSDEEGETYIANAAAAITAVDTKSDIRVVRPFGPPDGNKGRDVCDWTGDANYLAELASYAMPYEPTAVGPDANGPDEPFIAGADQDSKAQTGKVLVPATIKRGGEFLSEYEPISYTWDGVLPSSSLYAFTGKTGTGKTALMITGSIAVMKGNDDGSNEPVSKTIGCAVEQGRVAYVTKENPSDFRMKLAVNAYFHNIDHAFLNKNLCVLDGRSDSPEQICDALQRDAEHNGLFQLVNYDTFQAGYAADPRAKEFNENLAPLRFVERLRNLCSILGTPTVLVGCHPVKNATEDQLIPFGGGSSYNEFDGNLTLWKEPAIKLGWTKVRGPEFQPKYFRIEQLSCPDIIDKKDRQILLPVMRPITETDAAEREKNEGNLDLALLRSMAANPDATLLEWASAIGVRSKGTISKKLQKLKTMKFVEAGVSGKWRLTPKGQKEAQHK